MSKLRSRRRRRKLWLMLLWQDWKCFVCEKPATPDGVNREHVFPRKLGKEQGGEGVYERWNMVAAHEGCNHHKRDHEPSPEMIARLERLNQRRRLAQKLPLRPTPPS